MKHIVYCWEFGEGLGHIVPLVKIVEELISQGHRVTCVLKEINYAPILLSHVKVDFLSAPRVGVNPKKILPLNHADLLWNASYGNSDLVYAQLCVWRSLFGLLKPNRVITEFAPTARLAAQSLSIPVTAIDSGFSMPPVSDVEGDPLPPIRNVDSVNVASLVRSELRTLDILNKALARLAVDALGNFSDLFRGEVWYRNWIDFNHFGPHSCERHLGQIFGESRGPVPVWPSGTGPKVFAYLKPVHKESLTVLRVALELGFRVVAYLPGFQRCDVDALSGFGRLVASNVPYSLNNLPDDIEVGIWHSPTGAVARCIDSGMRMIFLPTHAEQRLACEAVVRAKLWAYVSTGNDNWPEVLARARSEPRTESKRRWLPADIRLFAGRLIGPQ